MQSLPSLAFVALLGLSLSVTWILPLINLHLALNQEKLLQETAQGLIDSNRLTRTNTSSALAGIVIPGIQLSDVKALEQGDYVIYQLDFNHTGLFANEFLQRDSLERQKTISILSDLI
mgnify:CR=1 FL=1|jgi:hypothetical protein